MTNEEILQFLKEKDFSLVVSISQKKHCEKFVAEFECNKYLRLSDRMCGKQLIADSLCRVMAYLSGLKKDGVENNKNG